MTKVTVRNTNKAAARKTDRTINPRAVTDVCRPFVINKGRSVDAIYVPQEREEWSANPLISALPRALDTVEAGKRLAREPRYDKDLRSQPGYIRRLLLHGAMKSLFVPLDVHLDIQQRVQCAIRTGYSDRNPMNLDYKEKLERQLDEFDQYASLDDAEMDSSATTASGFSIVGMSGAGKSRTILRCLQLLPQSIRHSLFRGQKFTCKQLVWLKLDCPFDGNPKGVCVDFFNTVDAVLGTTYSRNYAGGRRLILEMLSDMQLVAGNHYLGVLVVDEIQRLSLANSGGAAKMLNFFVQLVNKLGVPVILIGTYKGMTVLSGEFSQMRRGTGQGDLIWDRMDNDNQWRHFVQSLWRYQFVSHDSAPDEGEEKGTLSDALYDESQGIVDFAIKLFMFAQERAIETGHERITAGLIRKVAKDKLNIPREVLRALKTKNMAILERFEDLYPSAMKDYLSEQKLDPKIIGKLSKYPEIAALLKEYFATQSSSASSSDSEAPASETEI
jgi:hypothetical protein